MEDKSRRDQLQAVWFAAGMAVVIACLERAVVLSIFRHWHMWVFLALNLLLIAILFTSTHPPPNPPPKSQETEKAQPSDHHHEDAGENGLEASNEDDSSAFEEVEEENVEEYDDDERSSTLLSNEELNEKVEAFISRFRQQYLVSDVKMSRSRSRSDIVCGGAGGVFSKTITV